MLNILNATTKTTRKQKITKERYFYSYCHKITTLNILMSPSTIKKNAIDILLCWLLSVHLVI